MIDKNMNGLILLRELNVELENLHDEGIRLKEENRSNYNEEQFILIQNQLDEILKMIDNRVPFYDILSDIVDIYKVMLKKNYWSLNKTMTFKAERLIVDNALIYLKVKKLELELTYRKINEDQKKT